MFIVSSSSLELIKYRCLGYPISMASFYHYVQNKHEQCNRKGSGGPGAVMLAKLIINTGILFLSQKALSGLTHHELYGLYDDYPNTVAFCITHTDRCAVLLVENTAIPVNCFSHRHQNQRSKNIIIIKTLIQIHYIGINAIQFISVLHVRSTVFYSSTLPLIILTANI